MLTRFSAAAPPLRFDTGYASPGVTRITVLGEIDLSSAELFRVKLMIALFAGRPGRIEVDLAGVTFMDCGGITALVEGGKVAARTGCQLRIVSPQPIVRRVLELTGLLSVLTAEPALPGDAEVTASCGLPRRPQIQDAIGGVPAA